MGIETAAIAGGIIAAAGAFLKWATIPCLMAYELGKAVERVRNGREASAR